MGVKKKNFFRLYLCSSYDDDIRYNNIALLKLYVPIILRPFGRLPLCSTEAVLASKMSTCGMGSIAAYDLDQKADVLMEATFQEFQMSISNPFNVDMCREDNVCAMPVTQVWKNSKISQNPPPPREQSCFLFPMFSCATQQRSDQTISQTLPSDQTDHRATQISLIRLSCDPNLSDQTIVRPKSL